ncbi:TetR/AcrR family transcriptional regulator [Candidatus Solirubrobacter pratensis]|uniref:TetR/AcrR family transcriptional regulator n=1 Tax=Candidatus Solirubrobacter pratensis TaxID=1298857 RepID=UPI00040BC980|nr:TetR/AcrR family transcriptional regulator [Candidatus Solirubrobacter pratensis]
MVRAGLDPDAVVSAAARIADAEGLEAVTLARLAGELGVRTPSLYSHVAGLDDLRRRLSVRGARELADAMQEAAAGRSRRDALHAVASAYREYARTHPGTYQALQRSADLRDDDAAARAVRVVTAILAGYGLEGDDAIHATRAVRAALHGFAALAAGGGFGIALSVDETFERLVDLLDRGLQGASSASSGVGGVP